ncbi:hypothetical protein SAMD00019534_030660, partial [Acytostelium subglobosum LB1]|uniref:hypothetical protein n=1 Tax=Acytostelium subglobosum LB1 TaxID=1410327 RepID=UPI000644F8A7
MSDTQQQGSQQIPQQQQPQQQDDDDDIIPSQLNHIDDDATPLKILVIGEAACGKTSIINKYVLNKFLPKYKVTMGLDFFSKTINVDDTKVCLSLWDVAGQERFHHMIRSYFKNANGAIIVFDSTRILPTLNSASKWKLELDCCFPEEKSIPCILLANKSDLFNKSNEEVLAQQCEEFCQENSINKWFLTSAKEGTGLEESIEYLTRLILDSSKNGTAPPPTPTDKNTIKLSALWFRPSIVWLASITRSTPWDPRCTARLYTRPYYLLWFVYLPSDCDCWLACHIVARPPCVVFRQQPSVGIT